MSATETKSPPHSAIRRTPFRSRQTKSAAAPTTAETTVAAPTPAAVKVAALTERQASPIPAAPPTRTAAQVRKDQAHALARLNALVKDDEFLKELKAVKESPSAIAAGKIEFGLGPRRIVGYTAGVPAGEQLIATATVQGKYWILKVAVCDETRTVGAA